MPYSRTKSSRGLVRERWLSAAGTYGGALYGPGVTVSHLMAAVRFLAQWHSITWRLTPYDPNAESIATSLHARATNSPGGWSLREDSSETLDLDDLRHGGGLLKHVSHSCRKQILKGERAGITASVAATEAEWLEFVGLYRRSVARWGDKATTSYPDQLFRTLQSLAPDACRLWLAYHEGRLIGGSVNFYHHHHAVEWLAAYDSASFLLGVRNRLTAQMIEHAMAIGCSVYDFNPSGSLEGTRRFKQTFNTRQRQAPLLKRRSVLQCMREWIRR
jgi:hypothetical protein